MKTLVVYSSLTGNTKMVAEAIAQELGAEIARAEDNPAATGYDLVVVGFWVDKGTSDPKATKYLQGLENTTLGLFMTLGADPESEHARKSMLKAKENLSGSNKVVGEFTCQGKIDPQLIARMNQLFAGKEGSGNPHAPSKERDERHQKASTHPDAEDLAQAKKVFAALAAQLGNK